MILAADPNFETANVRRLMSQALNSYARQLYNAAKPAEANAVVTRARNSDRWRTGWNTRTWQPSFT
ncbi:MAG: hypothetical protein U0703_17945 [Anaerolineae bacterium]